ncbi:type IV pilus inner membrane component PilO [Deinococcus multiflagellatus]|uniref:type 4a pilus biogenesis protein PilO n=1 Tax=Deinococcus multiflagellatus TaxID=1656887 RepID=UPI001CCDD054|nr:type 4a pilus biogenesis protein PilO [Deinococcus multiflagellatus]MBZ9712750.1 type II secretion system protein M [Deinococcus multiflagellatus]
MSIKLAPRNVFLLVLAVCLIVGALWYTMRFQARQAEISALQSDLDSVNARVLTLRANAARLPALREEVATLSRERQVFLAALPQTANYNAVLDEVRLNASAAGATLSGFTVQTGNTTNLPAGVRPLSLNLNVSGRFAQLFQLLRSLETMNRFSTVTAVNLQLPAATSLDPRLESTMGLTVYTFDPAQAAATPGTAEAPNAAPAAPSAPAGGTQ